MSLLWSKNGFRGEYLARYMVSKFAFVSESNVGEDFGVDFYCGLIKDSLDKTYVHYDKPFLLQIKTTTTKPDIVYDTPNKISTLFNLNLPFYIGHLDLENGILDIHTTSMMWHTYLITKLNDISRVAFRFRAEFACDVISTPEIKDYKFPEKVTPFGNLKTNIIDLGNPIISLRLDEIETNRKLIEDCRTILSKCIDKDEANILNKKLNLFYYRWAHQYKTNDPSSFNFGYNFLDKSDGIPDLSPQNSIDSLDHYLVSLAIAFKENGDEENYENVCKLTRMISSPKHLEPVSEKYPSIYNRVSV
ncbi:MAG: hypothetical protein IPK50_12905 [Fibrobacterota bacterium]|nr:MAG: hypothetical protein IPK50_12905 [Fibrobacterota bacterium]